MQISPIKSPKGTNLEIISPNSQRFIRIQTKSRENKYEWYIILKFETAHLKNSI